MAESVGPWQFLAGSGMSTCPNLQEVYWGCFRIDENLRSFFPVFGAAEISAGLAGPGMRVVRTRPLRPIKLCAFQAACSATAVHARIANFGLRASRKPLSEKNAVGSMMPTSPSQPRRRDKAYALPALRQKKYQLEVYALSWNETKRELLAHVVPDICPT